MTLTGRTRYREQKRLFGSSMLVLQVEYNYVHDLLVAPIVECETVTAWRDATVEDLSVVSK